MNDPELRAALVAELNASAQVAEARAQLARLKTELAEASKRVRGLLDDLLVDRPLFAAISNLGGEEDVTEVARKGGYQAVEEHLAALDRAANEPEGETPPPPANRSRARVRAPRKPKRLEVPGVTEDRG